MIPLAAALLFAHDQPHPKRDLLLVERDAVVLVTRYELPAGEQAELARRLFDRDSNGRLDAGEQEKLAQWMVHTSLLYAAVRVDGAPLRAGETKVERDGLDEPVDSAGGITVEVRVSFAARLADGRRHAVTLEDRHKDRGVDVPTDARVEPPLALLETSAGRADLARGAVVDVLLEDEKPPLTLAIRLAPPAPRR